VKDISQKECRVYGIVVFLLSEGQQRLSLRCRKLKVLRYNYQRWLVMASPIFGVGKKREPDCMSANIREGIFAAMKIHQPHCNNTRLPHWTGM